MKNIIAVRYAASAPIGKTTLQFDIFDKRVQPVRQVLCRIYKRKLVLPVGIYSRPGLDTVHKLNRDNDKAT